MHAHVGCKSGFGWLVRQTRVDGKRSLSESTSKFNKNNNENVSSRQSDVTATEFDDVYVKKNTHPSGKSCETSTFIWCANKRTWTDENGRQSNFLCWKLNCHWKCLEFISGEEVTNPGCRTLFPQDLVRKHVSWSGDVLGSMALLRFVE